MSQKSLNFDRPYLHIDGKPIEGTDNTLGRILASMLSQEGSEDKYEFNKHAAWIRSLWNGESLSLDKADLDKLKDYVEKKAKASGWVKSQLFEVLDGEDDKPSAKAAKDGEHTPFPPVGPKPKK